MSIEKPNESVRQWRALFEAVYMGILAQMRLKEMPDAVLTSLTEYAAAWAEEAAKDRTMQLFLKQWGRP